MATEPSQRMLRVGEEVRRILAEAFARGEIPLQTPELITVTQVRMSPDLKNAHVYISVVQGKKTPVLLAQLRDMAPFCRKLLAQSMFLRVVPVLKFLYDETLETAYTVERLLRNPKVLEDLKKPNTPE